MRQLSYDMCRCKGVGCNDKTTCQRYLLDIPEDVKWISWADSLKDVRDVECEFYIPAEIIPFK